MADMTYDALLRAAGRGELTPEQQQQLAARLQPRSRRRWLWSAVLLLVAGTLVADSTVPGPDEAFALVNGSVLQHRDFYTALQDQAGIDTAVRVIVEASMRQEATKLGLLPTEKDVDTRLRQVIDERFGGNLAQFSEWMASSCTDETAVRRRLNNEMVDLRLRSRGVEVSEDKLKQYFLANQARRYDQPEAVRYRQVVLDTKEKANDILAKIKAGDLTFFTAAARHSVDPNAAQSGGLVGPQPLPLLMEAARPLYDALVKLQANESTPEPVEMEGKWFLLLLIERIAGKAVAYEQVAEYVRRDFLLERAVPENQYYGELMRRTDVANMPARYKAVEAQFGPQPERQPTKPTRPGVGPKPGPATPKR